MGDGFRSPSRSFRNPSTQYQAASAILFLYAHVLQRRVDWTDRVVRARRPGSLLYGSGLRLLECVRLRVKDVDLARREIVVRDGKAQKDRVTILPQRLIASLTTHLPARKYPQPKLSSFR